MSLVEARAPSYIVLAGNIGVGRRQLTRYLAEQIGAYPQYDELESNPFFVNFYDDPARHAYAAQLCFMAQTFVQQCEILTSAVPVVQSRSLAERFHVFVKALHEQGHLSDEQLSELDQQYHAYAAVIRPPDLLVFLRAPTEVLLERVRQRDRPGEHVDEAYLELLERHYSSWLDKYRAKDLSPILEIDVAQLDLRDPNSREDAIKLVLSQLENV